MTTDVTEQIRQAIDDLYPEMPPAARDNLVTGLASRLDFPQLIGTSEAAALLGIHINTIKKLCKSNHLPAAKIGGWYYIDRAKLLKMINDQTDKARLKIDRPG